MVIALFMSSIAFPYDKLMQINHIFSILIGNIQYPWRFISVATILASMVTCIGLWLSKKNGDFRMVTILLLVFTIISNNYLLSGVDLQRLEEKRIIVGQDVSVFEYQKSYDKISLKYNNAGMDIVK